MRGEERRDGVCRAGVRLEECGAWSMYGAGGKWVWGRGWGPWFRRAIDEGRGREGEGEKPGLGAMYMRAVVMMAYLA